jgi:uncharacterized cysteine cluster protein YcgN (CxxCxxCC family)
MTKPNNFWETKELSEMSTEEWESLCDGCGQCCLHKFIDEENNVLATDVACKFLDLETSRCSDYTNRKSLVPGCVLLRPDNIKTTMGLPKTCAYRLIAEGKPLYDWHPLISKTINSVKDRKISVIGRCVSEDGLTEEEIEHRITTVIDYNSDN